MVEGDATGRCLWWERHPTNRFLNPKVTEAKAALLAIKVAVKKGWHNVHIEGDCIDCKTYFSCSNCISFSYVRRARNSLAHALVKVSTTETLFCDCLPVRHDILQ
ncbi:hypothetical protein CDL12_21446 [Handroanthus impetiginosus]|uniref:RNase H type-1 domain-containing protein n=1 Tax=Handroanthus impetiginosus TaxID=429701 RepID=A0A2G9GL73_9LAMI|nr:hypothetical protein CDL12_21446 [Handroanthus impetiginosus]